LKPCNAVVHIDGGMTIDAALKKLKRSCDKAGLHADVRRHEHYLKPSEREAHKRARARKRRERSAERVAEAQERTAPRVRLAA